MKQLIYTSSLFLYITFVNSAPSITPRAPIISTIAASCINTELRSNWLVGDCLTGQDSTTRIQSAVNLPNKIANLDADLEWLVDGGYFRSCRNCRVEGAFLKCTCDRTWHSSKPSDYVTPPLNLDAHISVYNGHLLSNLTGPPTVPSGSSSNPVPKSFHYGIAGRTTCPSADTTEDLCKRQVNSCTTAPKTNTSESWWDFDEPKTCMVPIIYFPDIHYQFEEIKLTGEGTWELWGYDSESCTGEPIQVIKSEEMGVCKTPRKLIKAVTVRPAFNGDPR